MLATHCAASEVLTVTHSALEVHTIAEEVHLAHRLAYLPHPPDAAFGLYLTLTGTNKKSGAYLESQNALPFQSGALIRSDTVSLC